MKQDQYIAAYGGTNLMKFRNDGTVEMVNAVSHDSNLKKIEESLLLLYTNRERSSTEIHKDQIENSSEKMNVYDEMKKLADRTFKAICDGDTDTLGELMHRNWMTKKSLSSRISDGWIDAKYERAIKLGAKGGKLVGAGGGGFLLLIAEPEKHENIAKELGLRKIDFRFSQSGSRVIFVGKIHFRRN